MWTAVAALVVAAAVAACGGSGGESASSSTTSVANGPTTTVAVTVTSDVVYATDGPDSLTLDVYEPGGGATGRPAVVLVHGGGWNSGSASDVGPDAEAFAGAGIVSFAIDYRLDGDGTGKGWPDELGDVFDALTWVAGQADTYGLDPDRIGVYGSSAGGNLALLAATRRDGVSGPVPKAVVSWSGVTDLTSLTPPALEPGETPATTADAAHAPSGCAGDPVCLGILDPEAITGYIGCSLDDCPDDYADASPVTHVSASMPPTYLVSFEEDLVPLAQQQSLVTRCRLPGWSTSSRCSRVRATPRPPDRRRSGPPSSGSSRTCEGRPDELARLDVVLDRAV